MSIFEIILFFLEIALNFSIVNRQIRTCTGSADAERPPRLPRSVQHVGSEEADTSKDGISNAAAPGGSRVL